MRFIRGVGVGLVLLAMFTALGLAAGDYSVSFWGVNTGSSVLRSKRYQVDLVPYGTTVVHFEGLIRYVATGWPYLQANVLEGNLLLLRPLVREGSGEVWVMLQNGRQYRLLVRVKEGLLAPSYYLR